MSECQPLTRRRAGEDLMSEEGLDGTATVGLVNHKPAVKLDKRKHMVTGSRRVRTRICDAYPRGSLALHIPRLFCPVCTHGPAIVGTAHAGDGLFPLRASRSVLEEPASSGRSEGWRSAGRTRAHFFRRGSARASLEAGGSLAQHLKSGRGRSSAFQLYLVLGRGESEAMALVLIENSDDEN